MERKPQFFFVIITVTAIFLYIHHQNTIIRLTCEQQRIERAIAQLKQEEQALSKALCKACSLDGVAEHARELGMQPIPVAALYEIPGTPVGTGGAGHGA
jgi:cell division protein FtsL